MFKDPWNVATVLYAFAAVVTFLPVFLAIIKKVNPEEIRGDFEEAGQFDETQRARLHSHFQRMRGSLSFWKNGARKYKLMHYYALIWSIPSSVLIPILTQSIDDTTSGARLMVTIVSAFTAILLSFHKVLGVEEKFRSFRKGESGFYDLYRRMLDRPASFGESPDKQLEGYFKAVEALRQSARESETDLSALGESQDAFS